MENSSRSEASTDSGGEQSPLEQALVKTWLGAYGGMILALFGGVIGHNCFEWLEPSAKQVAGLAVAVAFLILYNSSLVLAWPRWARIPGLLPLAGIVFVMMFCMVAAALLVVLLFYSYYGSVIG